MALLRCLQQKIHPVRHVLATISIRYLYVHVRPACDIKILFNSSTATVEARLVARPDITQQQLLQQRPSLLNYLLLAFFAGLAIEARRLYWRRIHSVNYETASTATCWPLLCDSSQADASRLIVSVCSLLISLATLPANSNNKISQWRLVRLRWIQCYRNPSMLSIISWNRTFYCLLI